LLQKKKIRVTSSQIYTILKRHNLQNRELRLARLKEKAAKKTPAPKKKPVRILPGIEKQIIEISLQHPEFGAKRLLPLLTVENIEVSVSAVNSVLRRNGLENREKRLARSQEQQAVEAMQAETDDSPLLEEPELGPGAIQPIMPDAAEEPELGPEAIEPIIPDPAVEPQEIPEAIEQTIASPAAEAQPRPEIIEKPIKPPQVEPQPPATEIIEKTPPPRVPVDLNATKKAKIRGPWFLTLINLLLILLLVYLGLYAWQNVLQPWLEPELVAAIPPAPDTAPEQSVITAPPLSSYGIISDRNLFNISPKEASAPQKEIVVEKIDPAKKNLGLTLVGTVVVDDPKRSIAIIDNQKIRKQEAYREGDQANEVRIKKVMRNQVIIVTKEGDRLLTVDPEKTATRSKSTPYARQIPGNAGSRSQISKQMPAARTSSITLDLQEVASAFEDLETLLQEVNVAPYMQGDQAAGFRLNRIPANNIFRKMGLRSRDVIVGVNGEAISGPEQAEDLIRTVGEGGEVTITIKRRRRTRQLKLNIE
jgi:type II secretion system protein C